MRNARLSFLLLLFFIFSGIIFLFWSAFNNNCVTFYFLEYDYGDDPPDVETSAPSYPGMTAVEWELLECPGDDRHIIMYIPESYDPSIPSAVVWALHGMTQAIDEPQFTYPGYIQGSECYQLASYGNAIVIVPQGYNGPMFNGYGWNSSNPYPDNEDVEFFRWFIEDYLANNPVGDFGILSINHRRIYIGGYSMGGMINTCAGKIRGGQHYAAMYHLAGGKYFNETFNVTRKYPAHVVIGSDDTISGDSTQILLNTYITEGHPYYYQEYPGITHMEAMETQNINQFHEPKTYYEDCWDWLVQWALNREAELLNGTLENLGDYYNFSVLWKDADNDDPFYGMEVYIDGQNYPLLKNNPSDSNNTNGCLYSTTIASSVIGNGSHQYYFRAIEGDEYGTYSIIEPGQGPYNISVATTETNNFTISIAEKMPIADFSIDKTSANVGDEIHFTFSGTDGDPPSSFYWDFGDTHNSSERNPMHVYNSVGNFTVSLRIIDHDGDVDFMIKNDVISITESETEPQNPTPPIIPGFPAIILLSIAFSCSLGIAFYVSRRGLD